MGTISVIGGTIEGDFNISNNDNATSITILDTNVGDSCSFSITDNKIYIDGKPAHFVDKKTGQPIDLGTSYSLKNLNDPNKPTMLKMFKEHQIEMMLKNKLQKLLKRLENKQQMLKEKQKKLLKRLKNKLQMLKEKQKKLLKRL